MTTHKSEAYKNGHAAAQGGVATAIPESTQWWDDPDFKDGLLAWLVDDQTALQKLAEHLSADDFKPSKGVRDGQARWTTASRSLDYCSQYGKPIGAQLRADILAYAAQINMGTMRVNELLEYIKRLPTIDHRPPRDFVVQKVIEFKTNIAMKDTINEMADLLASGQLTNEKWEEITQRPLAVAGRKTAEVFDKPQWPEPLKTQAFYGLAGDVVHAIEPHTESDPAALLFQFLIGFGNMIGRSAHFRVGPTKHFTNLFAVLVGPTSKGRKGTGWQQIVHLLTELDAQWAADRIIGGLSSGEGLIAMIRDKEIKQTPIKEKGVITGYQEEIVDHGVQDKRLLIVEEEFANVLLMCFERQGNSLQQIIRNLWDTGDLNRATKIRQRATGAHGSIVGHITQEELLKQLNATAMANGFVNRFLWVCSKRAQLLPRGGQVPSTVLKNLAKRLQTASAFAAGVDLMQRSKDAGKLWESSYPELSEERSGLLGKATGRGEPIVMRVACIYALLDGSKIIKTVHLQAALAAWRYCLDSARFIFGDAVGDPVANEILKELRNRRQAGMTQSDINDYFHHNKPAQEIKRATALLQKQAQARVEKEESGGRPTVRWFAL